jgi:hypothetical protein
MTRLASISTVLLCAALCGCHVKASLNGERLGSGSGGGQPQQPPAGGDQQAYGGQGYGVGTAGVTAVTVITDDSGKQYHVQQGRKGAPGEVGCADGQREAFVDDHAFPNIAGCLASWTGEQSLRAKSAAASGCGDDGGACAAPADACAPGWHICGASGATADLKQVSGEQCEHAGGGRFSAGISHCKTNRDCEYDQAPDAVYPCMDDGWCSEPVCCGDDCGGFGVCQDGIWPKKTHIPVGTDQGCNHASSARAGGLLCCRG